MWKRRENRVVQKLYIVHQGRYKPPFYVVCGLAEEFDSGLRHGLKERNVDFAALLFFIALLI